MKSVSISFQYEENEYITAARKFLMASGYINIFKISGIALCYVLTIMSLNRFGPVTPVVLWFVLCIWWTAKLLWAYLVAPGNEFKKRSKMAGTFNFVFKKEGFTFTSDRGSADFKWSMFKKLYETDDMFILSRGKKNYTLMPKRAFDSAEDMEAFKALVGEGNSTMEYVVIK